VLYIHFPPISPPTSRKLSPIVQGVFYYDLVRMTMRLNIPQCVLAAVIEHFFFFFFFCVCDSLFFLLISAIEGLAISLVWNRDRGLGKGREYWVFDDLDPKSPHFYSCHS